jgi:hypothetical protein
MQANIPEYQEQILMEMIKRERKYSAMLSRNEKVLRFYSERGGSPVSSATLTEMMESTHDPLVVRKGVCEWMYRVSLTLRYYNPFKYFV